MIKRVYYTSIWHWNDDQRDLLYLELALEWWLVGSPQLRKFETQLMIKRISSTSIWISNDDQRDLFFSDNLELKWWSRGSPLPRFGFGMMIKGISSTLIIWNCKVEILSTILLALFHAKFACILAISNPIFRWESCKGSVWEGGKKCSRLCKNAETCG